MAIFQASYFENHDNPNPSMGITATFVYVLKVDYFLGQFGKVRDSFYVMASRISFGQFKFNDQIIDNKTFPSIRFTSDLWNLNNHGCLTATTNETLNKLDLRMTNCFEKHLTFCRKILLAKPNCSKISSFTNMSAFSLLLNPDLRMKYQLSVAYKKAEIMDMIKRLDLDKAYQAIFKSLWYSFTPCFDVNNITTDLLAESHTRESQ